MNEDATELVDFTLMGMPYQSTRAQAREVQQRMAEHPDYQRHLQLNRIVESLAITELSESSETGRMLANLTAELAALDNRLMKATRGIIDSVLAGTPDGL